MSMKGRLTSLVMLVLFALVCGLYLLLMPEPAPTAPPQAEDPTAERPSMDTFLEMRASDPLVSPADSREAVPLPPASPHAIPGEYTVSFPDEASMAAFIEQAEAAGVQVTGVIPGLRTVRVAASGSDLASLLKDGMQVENNFRMEVPTMPDPDFWQNRSLNAFNAGVLDFLGVPVGPERLQWGKGITIAILDTGWMGHSDIDGARVREIDLVGGSRDGEFSGHGTAVAGLVGSFNPFAPGISPGSDILSVRVLDGSGKGDAFTLAEAITVAVDNGAEVINMSLGGYGDSSLLQEAVTYATERGVVLVAASGNDGVGNLTYPAAYASVIGVTAVDANGNRAPFSNFGEGVDVAAPGYQIHALWEEDEYIYFNGTSASAPLVAGMAARLLESGRAANGQEVQELLTAQANDTGPPGDDPQYGAGILNAERLEKADEPGIYDIALADLYPAIEESDGSTFPLYVTFENRGTEYLPAATVEISVNGTPYFYTFSGIDLGEVESVQIPVPEASLGVDQAFTVTAKATLPNRYTDTRPENDAGDISLTKEPDE
jgi:hypothetical protein